jgi:hypothetical protein
MRFLVLDVSLPPSSHFWQLIKSSGGFDTRPVPPSVGHGLRLLSIFACSEADHLEATKAGLRKPRTRRSPGE